MEQLADDRPERLPRRDLFVLPLLSLLTLAFLLGTSELAARHFFSSGGRDTCEVANSVIGFSFKPGCVSRVKTPEGPWVTNSYNQCGYRTLQGCGTKPPGSIRIALIGSSVAQGFHVEYEKGFGQRAARDLTQRCGRPVEVQNLGRQMCSVACMFHRTSEALALKPDVLLLAVSPYDIETTESADVQKRFQPIPQRQEGAVSPIEAAQRRLLIKRVQRLVTQSRSVTAAEHFLFQDPATFLRLWLGYKDKADFLRPPFSAQWEERLRNVDLIVSEMAAQAHQANVPMVLIEIPNLAQVALIASRNPPPDADPRALNGRLEQIASHNNVTFVDVLDQFRNANDPSGLFYVVDGHLNGEGNAFISKPLVTRLTSGPEPLLSGCTRQDQPSTAGGQ